MDSENTHRKLGRTRRFTDESRVFEMLRRAHANLETVNVVEHALQEHRACFVWLDLTEEQYQKLIG